ncbi:hypothetical protein OAG1_12770 [Agarivorans sp. OAG1]|uniref:response regulator n=1 Tax=Agarivorans sp. OAG1 TaxID=3082387 RepID=UPI002B2CA1B1|nr:hypothetical protein OAG1_12770 [Agarivorans sp. OAG1]
MEVIVLINSSDPDIHQRVIEAGAKHCMSKPINHRKLAQALVDEKIAVNDVVTPMAKVSRSKLVLKVLAVDDNAANLKLISAMLHELVTQVDTCTNGLEAITKAEEESYDLILMDIQMPILDGISATQKIRQNSKNEQTPIIAVTAHALAGEKEQLLGQGVDDYLAKPIDESSLEKLIHRWQPNAKLLSREDFAATLDQPKTIEFENASLSWQLAMQRANNNQALAIDMFVMLQDSFVEIEEAIEQILNQQINADEFVLLVHRFRGGCAYSGCKRLESLTTTIEDSLRQHGDVAQVEPELLELSDEIEKVKQAAKQLNQQLS